MNIELKPCPICGGKRVLVVDGIESTSKGCTEKVRVHCESCDATPKTPCESIVKRNLICKEEDKQ